MATEKITLARVSHFTKDKDGNPLTTKNGKPYTRCLIDTVDGRKMSGFGNQTTSNWNEGMEVEVEVSESNGYLNFTVPKQANITEMAIKTHITQEIAPVKEALRLILDDFEIQKPKEEPKIGNTDVPYPESVDVETPW